ncbi:MAG: phenazine biosynthesis protein PhzF [Reyranella sp.]|nr:phenazine biosynthesis protein PhzF [Reyranella sp.]
MAAVEVVNIFTIDGTGGNPCPIVVDARSFEPQDMKEVASRFGHESGFVLPPRSGDYDFAFRFWVPNHKMEMCGHATIGALWLLAKHDLLPGKTLRIETLSGPVTGFVTHDAEGQPSVEITQPVGKVVPLTREQEADVLGVLRLERKDLLDVPLHNAITSRVKTLVPVKDPERLNALRSDMPAVEAVCTRIGSTGLYPYAVVDEQARSFEARQFPRSSGYPEDAATGIAATALAFGLLREGLVAADDREISILQGRAMGRASRIRVRIGFAGNQPVGCLLGGAVTPDVQPS